MRMHLTICSCAFCKRFSVPSFRPLRISPNSSMGCGMCVRCHTWLVSHTCPRLNDAIMSYLYGLSCMHAVHLRHVTRLLVAQAQAPSSRCEHFLHLTSSGRRIKRPIAHANVQSTTYRKTYPAERVTRHYFGLGAPTCGAKVSVVERCCAPSFVPLRKISAPFRPTGLGRG